MRFLAVFLGVSVFIKIISLANTVSFLLHPETFSTKCIDAEHCTHRPIDPRTLKYSFTHIKQLLNPKQYGTHSFVIYPFLKFVESISK